jgi:hypothetical protein
MKAAFIVLFLLGSVLTAPAKHAKGKAPSSSSSLGASKSQGVNKYLFNKKGRVYWRNAEVAALTAGVTAGGIILNNYIMAEIDKTRLRNEVNELRNAPGATRPTTSQPVPQPNPPVEFPPPGIQAPPGITNGRV